MWNKAYERDLQIENYEEDCDSYDESCDEEEDDKKMEVEEEKKVETSKRTFEARTFLHDVYNKITRVFQSYDDMKQEEKIDSTD